MNDSDQFYEDDDLLLQLVLLSSMTKSEMISKQQIVPEETEAPKNPIPIEVKKEEVCNEIPKKPCENNNSHISKVCDKKRCNMDGCKNKLSLIDLSLGCKCEYIYCTKHRLPESHNCTFDHKSNDKKLLEKTVQKCVSDKVTKI